MIRIRNATQDDIEPFKEVIKSSILVLCKDFYTPDQIKALLGQFPDFDLYAKWIDERVLIVAENNGVVIGFAQYTPELALIEAVHVEPSMARSGIGNMLVNAIEKVAMSQGASKISLESSLNAVEFYKKCGYQRKQSSSYLCKDGVTLETVSFEKVLNS